MDALRSNRYPVKLRLAGRLALKLQEPFRTARRPGVDVMLARSSARFLSTTRYHWNTTDPEGGRLSAADPRADFICISRRPGHPQTCPIRTSLLNWPGVSSPRAQALMGKLDLRRATFTWRAARTLRSTAWPMTYLRGRGRRCSRRRVPAIHLHLAQLRRQQELITRSGI